MMAALPVRCKYFLKAIYRVPGKKYKISTLNSSLERYPIRGKESRVYRRE
jgi:hypothetical protein